MADWAKRMRTHRAQIGNTLLMNLYEAAHLARSLMQEHGLDGWSFAFDHARRRFGACNYTRKRITLSRPLVLLNGIEQVRDTVLHEIAHALCPGDKHGPRWRATCARLGARPKRCYGDEEVVSPQRPPARYLLGCARCDWWSPRRRRVKGKYVCRTCRGRVVYREAAGA
jgi:predicted SprT family Zn-dependent metalloprotease